VIFIFFLSIFIIIKEKGIENDFKNKLVIILKAKKRIFSFSSIYIHSSEKKTIIIVILINENNRNRREKKFVSENIKIDRSMRK
jgi:hypothetical protein